MRYFKDLREPALVFKQVRPYRQYVEKIMERFANPCLKDEWMVGLQKRVEKDDEYGEILKPH
ncbi:hypothetical protein L226DRAFT_568560 [Lentinus tigrinus ALCF2SS1-7]|uniref:uncharacterized protein n=1 Tax=Lentinus tigrinus ALCF2SS1-7 TaxID=1328758 RepID=UPI001165F938|nr:hypothetical protein L226DRAFT_568560 [Lentinus tigrinus ALCF2SS1-7]